MTDLEIIERDLKEMRNNMQSWDTPFYGVLAVFCILIGALWTSEAALMALIPVGLLWHSNHKFDRWRDETLAMLKESHKKEQESRGRTSCVPCIR